MKLSFDSLTLDIPRGDFVHLGQLGYLVVHARGNATKEEFKKSVLEAVEKVLDNL